MYSTILALSIIVALATIGTGIISVVKPNSVKIKGRTVTRFSIVAFAFALMAFVVVFAPDAVRAAGEGSASSDGLSYLAAGISTGLAAIGSGIAVASVGSAALGALSEDPKVFGKTLIYVGLAEGIAIYGLIISIMIIGNLS